MNKSLLRKSAIIGASLALLLAFVPAVSLAAELRGGNQPTVGSGETINDDLYIAGGSVVSSGKIQGDLTAAGGTILVSGPVGQSANIAGGTLTLLGDVGGSVRAAGGNITIESKIKNDAVVAGGQIQITGGDVGRDVVVAGGSVRIESPVHGKIRFTGGELYIDAPVTGDVEITARKVTLGSGAVLAGNLTYKAAEPAVMTPGAQVKGAVHYTPQISKHGEVKAQVLSLIVFLGLMKLLVLLIGSFLVGLLLRRLAVDVAKSVHAQPLAELGRGVVVLIVLPIVSIFLLATVVGIPFGILGLLGFVGEIIFCSLLAPVLLGSFLWKWIKKQESVEVSWQSILVGVVVYGLLGFIPILGWLVQLVLLLMAVGATIKMKWNIVKAWR